MSKRNWRFDRLHHVVASSPSRRPRGGPAASSPGKDARQFRASKARSFRSALAKSRGPVTGVAALEEAIIHEFAELLRWTDDARTIGEALRGLAQRLASQSRVEWQPGRDRPGESIPGAFCFPVGLGERALGCLVVRPRAGDHLILPTLTRRRLSTLCMLAASIDHDGESSRGATVESPDRVSVEKDAPGTPDVERGPGGEPPGIQVDPSASSTIESFEEAIGAMTSVPKVHDATYLTAVLPFALGQARRHSETLSVLCIEVDRRAGIAELLGDVRAEHAIQSTGRQIAAQIRSSDFVCRLDDERLLAVLPRAAIEDAARLAWKLCQDVKRNPENLPEVGGVTLSIGVAEFPACAENVFELFDAADDALGEAKRRGRDQAHAAPSRHPQDRLQTA